LDSGNSFKDEETFFWVGCKRKRLIHHPDCEKIPWTKAPFLSLYTSLTDAFRDGYKRCCQCITALEAAPFLEEAERLGIEDKIGRLHQRKRYKKALAAQERRIEEALKEVLQDEEAWLDSRDSTDADFGTD